MWYSFHGVAVAMAPLVVLVLTLVSFWSFHLLPGLTKRQGQHREASLPPGSMGLPLIGETLEFFTRSPSLDLYPFFKQRLQRHGPIFKTNLIGKDFIVSLDPELNNYLFQQEEKAFQIWFPESFMRILGEENLVLSSGSFHKHIRNMILRVFGPENLRLALLHDVQGTVKRSLRSWLDMPSIELKPSISSMIFSVTAKWLISYEASLASGKLWKNYDAFTKGLVSFPLNIPGTAFYKCMQGRNNVMKTLKQLLATRKREERKENKDFFDVVISELNKPDSVLTENFALNLVFLLLFASFETTSSAITVALKFLSDNPKALQELEVEHQQIQKRSGSLDSEITWEDYKSMKFTSHVIHESLRLANIAPVLFRKAKQDVQIKGYTIPEGWIVMVCPSAIHLNPTTYEDPTVFNPWRWKDISEPVGGSKDFVAFGSGLRFCVGADFAKLQIAVFLHFLVTNYRWKLIRGGNMVLCPGLGFPNGFEVQLLPKA